MNLNSPLYNSQTFAKISLTEENLVNKNLYPTTSLNNLMAK